MPVQSLGTDLGPTARGERGVGKGTRLHNFHPHTGSLGQFLAGSLGVSLESELPPAWVNCLYAFPHLDLDPSFTSGAHLQL